LDQMRHAAHSDLTSSDAGRAMAGRHVGHGRHAGHSVAMFRDKFWWSLTLTIPVIVWSADVQRWLGYTAPLFPESKWIPAVFGTTVFLYAGVVFLSGARGELSERKPGMMTLISLGILVSFGASFAATFGLFEVEVWWEVATLITIMILGHWLEMRAVTQAHGALNALVAMLPDTAERVDGSEIRPIPVRQLRAGDLVLVRPGTRVPADGEVVEGTANVGESLITGESKPVGKSPGAKVIAGTVAGGGSLRVSVTAVGDATALPGIMRLGKRGPGFWIACPSSRGSRSGTSFLCGTDCQRDDINLLVARGRQRTRFDPRRHRAHHRLPARSRPCHSTRDCHLDLTRRAERPACQRQARPRASAQSGCDRFRQNRNAHARFSGAFGRSGCAGR